MMFGSKVKYGITYKTNQKSFDIYRRKFEHDFKVNVVKQNLDGCKGLPFETMNAFIVSKVNLIKFYDIDTYVEMKNSMITIPLLESQTREPNEIIGLAKDVNENYLAIISGKNLIMDQQKPNQLFIFKRIRDTNTTEPDKFVQIKRIVIKDMPEFDSISMQFVFQTTKGGREPNSLIFAKMDKLMVLNYETEAIVDLYSYEVPLTR